MRLLVCGAAGFMGSNFVRSWLAERPDDHVVCYDLLTYAGTLDNLTDVRDRVVFVQGDICDAGVVEGVLGEQDVDVIVNFAAESHNSYAVLDPGRFMRTNALGTQALLEAARRRGVVRFHQISTCEVYGDLPLEGGEAFAESSPYRPRTPYSASKAAADHIVRAYHETYELPVTISNCCNNYGPYQFPEKLVPLFVTRALDDLPLPLYESSANRREWIHVHDHCRGIMRVLLDGRVGETYNIGTGDERTIAEIADAILAILGKPSSLKTIVPDRPGHDRRFLLDSTRIRTELGWSPEVAFDDGLRETVEWYAERRSWWEPLRERAPVAEERAWA